MTHADDARREAERRWPEDDAGMELLRREFIAGAEWQASQPVTVESGHTHNGLCLLDGCTESDEETPQPVTVTTEQVRGAVAEITSADGFEFDDDAVTFVAAVVKALGVEVSPDA